MHSLAIALSEDPAYRVTGSDDEIFEPSRSRLQAHGLLPAETGWHPERIDGSVDAVVVGMHATADNPELRRARELGLRIYSFPEYLYEHTRGKKRVVVGGSHGKTTTTAMILHVLHRAGIEADYMVGAQIEGLDNMVRLSADARVAVFEGDEYLTSPLDPRPKFHLYKPHVAVLTGIAWDHINVFPTFDCYVEQFRRFAELIEPHGCLIYYEGDKTCAALPPGCDRTSPRCSTARPPTRCARGRPACSPGTARWLCRCSANTICKTSKRRGWRAGNWAWRRRTSSAP